MSARSGTMLSASLRRRVRPAVFLLLAASACSTWRVQQGPAPQVIAAHGGGRLRVVRHDQSVVEMTEARVVGDSIVGLHAISLRRIAFATADVQRVEARRVDALRTGALTVGVAVVVTAIAVLAAIAIVFSDPNY